MSLAITTAQLTYMRAQVAQLLPGTAIIKAPAFASDGAGGGTVTYSAVTGGTVACRVDPLGSKSNNNGINFGEETIKVHYQFTAPYDAPLAVDYQVTFDSRDYEVVQLDIDHNNRVSRRAIIAEVRA